MVGAMTDLSNNKVNYQRIYLVSLNQTYICFDVEQLKNAKQEVKLKRCQGVQDDIAWRIRTNVPTRYLINPSKGCIQNDESITLQLTIELIGNKFHPNHRLTLQAIAMIGGCNERTIWKHPNAKNFEKVQMIRLKLSTVLINIEMSRHEVFLNAIRAKNLESFIENNSTTGSTDIKELEKLQHTLEEDFSNVQKNTLRAKRLKTILEQALDSRRLTLVELKRRVMESEQETKKLRKKLEDKEMELQLAQRKHTNTMAYATCRIS